MKATVWYRGSVRSGQCLLMAGQLLSLCVSVSQGFAQDLAMTGGLPGGERVDSALTVDLRSPQLELASVDNNLSTDNTSVGVATPTIFTIAGTGDLGFNGDGNLATKAHLWFAASVAIDQDGNVFIADSFNNRIRRVDARTGLIATFAGTGQPGFEGDGDLAIEAKLNSPAGVAVDAKGNVLIADTFNNRVRIVDVRTGIIRTMTGTGIQGASGDGGLAVGAQLSEPAGLCVDVAGHVLIADTGNHRIRRVEAGTGMMSTVAGTGVSGFSGDGGPGISAQLNGPTAVAADARGHVVIADTANNRVRLVEPATGRIDTIAGNGVQGFAGDGGLAAHAQLMEPSGVAVDAKGDVLVSDSFNNRVRHIDMSTGIIATAVGVGTRGVSGNGTAAVLAELNNPVGLTKDAFGNIVVADAGNNRIIRVIAEER